jgi:hypothetical protein
MSTTSFDTGLAVDGHPVRVSGGGLFYAVVNGETISSPVFDRLEIDIAAHLADLVEKRERQRRQAARRAVGRMQVWTRRDIRGHLEQATLRGYHATTGTPLLTFADGGKPIGKKYYALFHSLGQEQVDAVNGLIDAARAADRAVEDQAERAVRKSRLSGEAKDGHVVVMHGKYTREAREVARFPFAVDGRVLTAVVNGVPLSGETMHDLQGEVVRHLHPAYGRQVWIVDDRGPALLPGPREYLGDDRLHDPDDQRYGSSLKVFEDRAEAEEYLRLQKERESVRRALRDALAALPRLERGEDEAEEGDEEQ